jgi:hypothetical protein
MNRNFLLTIFFVIYVTTSYAKNLPVEQFTAKENALLKNSAVVNKKKLALTKRQAKLKKMLASNTKPLNEKHIIAKISELKDNSGLVYVGAKINQADVEDYLQQMQTIVGNSNFQRMRANQAQRDQQSFHVTLINPYEYQTLTKPINFEQQIAFTLHGLGRVQKKLSKHATTPFVQQSYFVVVSSPQGQYFRQQYLLKRKDFHITLGFDPHDIYDISKGKERLLTITNK